MQCPVRGCKCSSIPRVLKYAGKYSGEMILGLSWHQLETESAQIASFGRVRLDGKVAYLATVSTGGYPRVHPVTPIIGSGRCFLFAEPDSSKVRDLEANGLYSLHCSMTDSSGSSGEFKMAGQAIRIEDADVRLEAEADCNFRPAAKSLLFELTLNDVVATSYKGGRPDRRRWSAAV